MVYFKRMFDFVTYRMAEETDYELCPESYKDDGSTVTIPSGTAAREDSENWLVIGGAVYYIRSATPERDKTTLKLEPPMMAFDRDVIYAEASTTEEFIDNMVSTHFARQDDPMYRIAAQVRASGSHALIKPDEVLTAEAALQAGEALGAVTFNFYDYLTKLRNGYDIFCDFQIEDNSLVLRVAERSFAEVNIVPGDGHSVLESRSYGSQDTTAKVTILCEKDGTTTASDWYLTEQGTIQQARPASRVRGKWAVKRITADAGQTDAETAEAIRAAAADAFGDRITGAHKIEFWSDQALRLGDVVNMRLDGQRVTGSISKVNLICGSSRRLYVTGDLAVTLTEKLKRK